METLTDIVYCSLKEEDNQTEGWNKATIDYITNHKRMVYSTIRGIARSRGKFLAYADVEDLFQIISTYLYKCDDYNLEKACTENTIVSLEGYVKTCIKYCTIRYVTNMYDDEKTKISEFVTDDEGKEMSIFDTVSDKSHEQSFNNYGYDLKEICDMFECERYTFGPDIFLVWFVRLQTMIKGKADKYKDVLEILGISKKELLDIERNSVVDGVMTSIARAVSIIGVEDAIDVLKDYTYSYRRIVDVVDLF